MQSSGAKRVVSIIGVGSPLRSDDAVGPVAVDAFRRQMQSGAPAYPTLEIRTATVHQLLPELAPDLAESSLIVFIDASVELAPGQVRLTQVEASASAAGDPHGYEAAALLETAMQLYHASPPVFMLAVGAASFEYGETLSSPVRQALPRVSEALHGLLREL